VTDSQSGSEPASVGESGGRRVRPDEASLRAGFGAAAGALRRYLFCMCGDWHEAQDLAQTALLKAWRKRHGFDGKAELRTWIFAIARNHWRDRLRTRRTRPRMERMSAEFATAGPGPVTAAARGELARAITVALETLPADQREALALRESQGLRFRQIAELLGVPVATVKSRVRYALLKLAKQLEPFRRELEE